MNARPQILIACNKHVREQYLAATDFARLEAFADWDWFECEGGSIYDTNPDSETARTLGERLGSYDGLVVCHGCPTIDAAILDQAPELKIIGELEGDRFASRIDVEAAWERGVCTVDTTNGSSYPVSEWALALIIISLRNAGAQFRRLIAGDVSPRPHSDFGFIHGDLTGKRVGLIGCGHIGRRLIQFLRPFQTEVWVCDPYLAREMADAVGFLKTSLDNVMSQCDAIVCLAPHTPRTERMIGQRELDLIRPGAVFVNVSRGKVVDSDALVRRLKRGDIVAGLDVFDPDVGAEDAYGDKEVLPLGKRLRHPPHRRRDRAELPAFFRADGRRTRPLLPRARDPLRPDAALRRQPPRQRVSRLGSKGVEP